MLRVGYRLTSKDAYKVTCSVGANVTNYARASLQLGKPLTVKHGVRLNCKVV